MTSNSIQLVVETNKEVIEVKSAGQSKFPKTGKGKRSFHSKNANSRVYRSRRQSESLTVSTARQQDGRDKTDRTATLNDILGTKQSIPDNHDKMSDRKAYQDEKIEKGSNKSAPNSSLHSSIVETEKGVEGSKKDEKSRETKQDPNRSTFDKVNQQSSSSINFTQFEDLMHHIEQNRSIQEIANLVNSQSANIFGVANQGKKPLDPDA